MTEPTYKREREQDRREQDRREQDRRDELTLRTQLREADERLENLEHVVRLRSSQGSGGTFLKWLSGICSALAVAATIAAVTTFINVEVTKERVGRIEEARKEEWQAAREEANASRATAANLRVLAEQIAAVRDLLTRVDGRLDRIEQGQRRSR